MEKSYNTGGVTGDVNYNYNGLNHVVRPCVFWSPETEGEHPHDVIHFPASNITRTVGEVAWFPYCKSKPWSCKYYDRVMEPDKKFGNS